MANNYDPAYEYKNNHYYIKYNEQKELIKQKYPAEIFDLQHQAAKNSKSRNILKQHYIQNYQELHRQYLRELADLIFEPGGNYQQFIWDIIPEVELQEMERRARGRANRGNGMSEEYY